MATDLKSILTNTKTIYMSDSNLNSLLDYERVLDEFDLYTFKNWKIGELVEGPIYEKYFVTCKWMYPFRKMPDPSGGKDYWTTAVKSHTKRIRLNIQLKSRVLMILSQAQKHHV